MSAAKLAALHAAFDGLDNSDVITAFVSDKAARKVRHGAEHGNIKALTAVEEERKNWPPYMVMSSWDFPDHHGNTAIHFAAKNGHEECIEFLLSRGVTTHTVPTATRFPGMCLRDCSSLQALASQLNEQCVAPLHIAKTYEVAFLLLKYDADPVVLDNMGRTAYDVHKTNRMGGGGNLGKSGKKVVEAFGKHHQITGVAARVILKERNMSKSDKALRAHDIQAIADAKAVALHKEEVKSMYAQGIGAMVMKDFDGASERFGATLELDPTHTGALLKLADMASKGQGSAQATLEKVYAAGEAAEAEAAAKEAKMAAEEAIRATGPEPEPELVSDLRPSRPSLGTGPPATVVMGEGIARTTLLHSVEAHPMSPMSIPPRIASNGYVPTPPREKKPQAAATGSGSGGGELARQSSVPTMSPKAPPVPASGRRTLGEQFSVPACSGPKALPINMGRHVKIGGGISLLRAPKANWGRAKAKALFSVSGT